MEGRKGKVGEAGGRIGGEARYGKMRIHRTVLLNETIDGLNLGKGAKVADATFGGGGHSREICRRYPDVKIVAIDQDMDALEDGRRKFENINCHISFENKNFREMNFQEGSLDGIIFDLGLSSDQLESSGRGFSFVKDEPLLMNMKKSTKEVPSPETVTAYEVVNDWSEESLADIIYGFGGERYARRVARAIVEARVVEPIKTTLELAKLIEEAVPGVYRRGRIHPATRTFQAIRIAVNDELEALKVGLERGFDFLKKDGRMCVISFHSLEDRIVKNFYKEKVKEGRAKLVNKKVITAGEEELRSNPRARSAKLRTLEKTK